ncbi:MAG TPA: DUF1178 family protein [Caulobacteraceae bacterium]|nr:DUF1178 family protein [Caulobacteraceae bacterium]
MIRYALSCAHGHDFEGWFSAAADFDDQAQRGLLACPVCATSAVGKQIMAPAVVRGGGAKAPEAPAASASVPSVAGKRVMMMEAMGRLRAHVQETFDYVGERFAAEARAIHQGEAEERGIYGEASAAEVRELVEEGVPVAPLPPEPPKKNELN